MPYYPERKPEMTGAESHTHRARDERSQAQAAEKRGRLLRWFLVLASCALIGYGGVRLIQYQSDLSSSLETSRELQEIHERTETEETKPASGMIASPSSSLMSSPDPLPATERSPADQNPDDELLHPVAYPDNPLPMISEQFRKLRRKSEYIIGWISMDGVEEAVAQKDNSFFLNHDALGKRNGNGAIFLDQSIRLTTRPYLLILYGHNMKSGNMFGRLKKYKESAYFYQHRIIRFDSMYEEGRYAVFSVMEMDTTPGVARWYSLWSLNSDSRADREEAIRTLERRSAVSSELDVQADDQILLLVTCLDGETERLVVAARRLREDETANHLTIRSGS